MLKRSALVFAIITGFLASPALAEAPEVVMLGDSLTQGYGLPEADGLVPQLQAWLDAEGVPAKLVNMGVSGDTTAGGLSRVAWSLTPETKAVVVALGGNDLLRGLPPQDVRANLDAMLAELKKRDIPVVLTGMMASPNMGSDYAKAFNPIYPELAAKYEVSFYPFILDNVVTDKALMLPDGIHPNPQGISKVVAGISNMVAEELKG